MQCTYHFQNPIISICVAPHKCQCQRKLCHECLYIHGVDIIQQTIPIKQFQEKALQILKDSKLDQKLEITYQRKAFENMLSQTQNRLHSLWNDLSESIKQIYDMIDKENNYYTDLIKQNPAESSFTTLEKLVFIVQGKSINDWNGREDQELVGMLLCKIPIKQQKRFRHFLSKMIKFYSRNQPVYVYKPKQNLLEIFDYAKQIDKQSLSVILEKLKKEKISDCLYFLLNLSIQKQYEHQINQTKDSKSGINNTTYIHDILRNLLEHDFNKIDYSLKDSIETTQALIQKISEKKKIIPFLIFLVNLTAIDDQFIQSGSNSLNLLVQMKVDLTCRCFENIKIQNTSLIGGNFARCYFSGSKFNNVDLSGTNLNGALLFNCNWKNIKINKLNQLDKLDQLDGHFSNVTSVCFSPDGTTLASGSYDKSICLWDVKTGQQKVKMAGHSSYVTSVCFSSDRITLASGSVDNSIGLWDIRTGKKIAQLDGHSNSVYSVCFSPNGTILASGSWDKTIRLWDVKAGQQNAQLDISEYIWILYFIPYIGILVRSVGCSPFGLSQQGGQFQQKGMCQKQLIVSQKHNQFKYIYQKQIYKKI